jgi:hypothetical protein
MALRTTSAPEEHKRLKGKKKKKKKKKKKTHLQVPLPPFQLRSE